MQYKVCGKCQGVCTKVANQGFLSPSYLTLLEFSAIIEKCQESCRDANLLCNSNFYLTNSPTTQIIKLDLKVETFKHFIMILAKQNVVLNCQR